MQHITWRVKKHSRAECLNVIFLFWWFWPVYSIILQVFMSDRAVSYLGYLFFMLLFFSALCINRRRLKKSFIIFVLLYILFGLINIFLVSYWYFVTVEMGASLIKFIVPVYIISYSDNGTMRNLIFKWYHWGIYHTFFLPLIYILMNCGVIGYGGVATAVVPNIVILLIGFYYYGWNKLEGFLMFLVNFCFLFLFGSRMPMVAILIVGAYLCIVWKKMFGHIKIFFVMGLTIIITVFVMNLREIIDILVGYCAVMGIDSRTITKLSQDVGEISLIEMMKSSGRGDIWEISWKFLGNQFGMPGGFGVIRALTNGSKYFSHNIFLDISIMLGIFAIPLVMAVLYQLYRKYQLFSKENFVFCTVYGFFFFICSLTGAHFLGDSYSIVFWGMLFFMEIRNNG